MGVLPISRFLESLIKKNFHNSRTSNDIDMECGPVTQLYKRNTATMMPCQQIVTSLSIFRCVANLEQCGSQIPGAWLHFLKDL